MGPAGRLLDRALGGAGIDRSYTYVTNVVKHFKWEPRGKPRRHKTDRPPTLLGNKFPVSQQRGQPFTTALAPHAVATIHRSSILRQPTDADRHREMGRFVKDLQVVVALLNGR